MDKRAESFLRLLKIMDELREECPWDKVQTKESIRHLSIEEVYELSDAILKDDYQNIKEELGDLLLHIVFYSKMANEKNKFNITDVANAICDKLIERHPHIYGDEKASDPESVKQNWEKIKLKGKSPKTSVLDGVPSSMPPIVKAMRMQDKAAQVGFDWENKEQVWAKVEEELNEFKAIINKKLGGAREELNFYQDQMKESEMNDDDIKFSGMEDGGHTNDKEHLSTMANRQTKFIQNLENALIRIENKTYGICRMTGKLIDKKRLKAVPHATLSMEAKTKGKKRK